MCYFKSIEVLDIVNEALSMCGYRYMRVHIGQLIDGIEILLAVLSNEIFHTGSYSGSWKRTLLARFRFLTSNSFRLIRHLPKFSWVSYLLLLEQMTGYL